MKSSYFINTLLIVGLLSTILSSCKKDDKSADNTIKDIDGNIYHTLTIGKQVWMVENLKTTKYNDGSTIPIVTDGATWAQLTTPAYCWQDNNAGFKDTYGALYNWYTVSSGKLCPTGWRVPTETDWNTLITYLGGWSVAGGKLKEVGTSHWITPNTSATNESGFLAFAGGCRRAYSNGLGWYDSNFPDLGYEGSWWSSTTYPSEDGFVILELYYNKGYADLYIAEGFKEDSRFADGLSVRCIKE